MMGRILGRFVLLTCARATSSVDLMLKGALNLEGDAPFLFARRGEPFNFARDWANTSIAREGCWIMRERGAGPEKANRTICYARPEGFTLSVTPSIFDFILSRAPLVSRVVKAVAAMGANASGLYDDGNQFSGVEDARARGTMLIQSAGSLHHGADQFDSGRAKRERFSPVSRERQREG